MYSLINLLFLTGLISTVVISDTPVSITTNHLKKETVSTKSASKGAISPGYSALKLFLEDEQYLTTIRRTKMVFTFSSISDKSVVLIDQISDSSEQAIEDLEELAREKPAFSFEAFSDEGIGKATFDSLRYTTAKEFLFDDDFEKDLLISQLKVLRLISHLAIELEEKETNAKRKKWLKKIADKYENYYQSVTARIFIPAKA